MNRQSPLYVMVFMVVLASVFGFGVSFVNYATLPVLEKNEKLHRNRIMAKAFMLDVQDISAEAYERAVKEKIETINIKKPGAGEHTVYRNRNNGETGFIFTGFGFWDRITGIMVLDPELKKIVNIQFLEQHETPGLGARIEEQWFTEQFRGVAVKWDDPSGSAIVIGKKSSGPNSVDAITGASQTSMALMGILNRGLADFRKFHDMKEK